MKKYLLNIFSVFCLLLFAFHQKGYASHSMGADITYTCVGPNTYEITLSFYRDCVGVAADDSAYLDLSSSCQGLYYVYLLRVPGTGQEITPLCPSEISTCNGGVFTGIQEYVYKRTVILPGQCADWQFSYNQCCRNNAITNIASPSSWYMYVYATLNNLISPCNNSPTFSNKPVPFVCLGQQFCFNHGAYDVDGDSLVYSLITPWDSPSYPISYLFPFSATNPLSSSPAVSFNPYTGDICMTPTALEVTVMAVLVQEYRNGVLIGSVERDIQVTVIQCSNQVPSLTGMNGTTDFSAVVCAGSQICFTINSTDADGTQNTFVSWDNSIPGATFSVAAGSRQSATFCWTPTLADVNSSPHCFTASVHDDNCPIWGSQIFSYCITVESIQVSIPDQTVGCNGTTTLTPTITGSSSGYTYLWSTGATTQTINAGPGNYSLTVSNGGCSATGNVTVSQTAGVTTSVNSTPVTCNGDADGSASVSVNGGTGPFTYNWSPSGGTGITAGNLAAGNYTVTVTDAMGCTSSVNVTVTEPALLTSSATSTDVLCNGGNDGTASATALNGTPGYTYSWSPSGGSASTANGLQAGSYTVTVTDANGCTTSATTTISEPSVLTASAVSTDVLCYGESNGTASVVAGSGIPGYTYVWSPSGGTSSNAAGLSAGNYSVTVTDANGCTITANATVSEPTELMAAASATDALCSGGTDGTASVVANDGTPGYSYTWSPAGGNSSNANGLTAGIYTVTVTDANGCTVTASATVNEPSLLTAAVQSSPALCNGSADGSVTASASNGTPVYSYAWSSGGTGSTESGLSAGTYTVIITDANGCTTSTDIDVTEPAALNASVSAADALCFGSADGSATVSPIYGTPSYTYAWSSGGSAALENGLSAGTYSVIVTDANGCTLTTSATINEPAQLSASAIVTDVLCYGGSDGSATASALGGTAGYNYSWSSGGNTANENSLAAGNYTVTVTDANGCTVTASATINEPLPLTASANAIPVMCNGGTDGSVTATVQDGTPGYSYAWSSGGASATETGLSSGMYVVTVTDANGCTTSASALVTEPSQLSASVSSTDVLCNGGADGTSTVTAIDGTPGYSYSWTSGGNAALETGLSSGNYQVVVTDANGCTTNVSITINEPPAISITIDSDSALCHGSADGSLSAVIAGGTGGYSFLWTPGNNATATLTGLQAGNYNVSVTDDNGCTSISQQTVYEPALLSLSMLSMPALCNGDSSGSADAQIAGGTAGYMYSWFPNYCTTSAASNLRAGNYSVIVTDANGCAISDSIVVGEPPAMALATNTVAALCGASNGSASVNVNGGSAPYQYSWAPSGGTASQETNIAAGAYTVIVTDANGCTSNAIANVLNTGGPGVTAAMTAAVSCNGGNDGSASVNVTSGTAPYTYQWSPAGGNGSAATNLTAGNYSVTVTDANGCVSSDNIIITEPTPVAVQASGIPTLCFGSADGSASVNAAGGTGPYTYLWHPGGAMASTASGLASGNYSVTVTDANGCQAATTVLIQQPSPVSLSLSSTPALCHGAASGSATVNATGGTGAYSYTWSPSNASTQVSGNIASGNYSVIVTDANGCDADDSVFVSEPSPVHATSFTTPATCGTSNGTAGVNASGGTAPYTYQWSPITCTTPVAANLPAGNFTATITDANGCTTTAQAIVSNAGGPVATAAVLSNISCYGGSDGSASVNVSSGNGPFTYMWSPAGGSGTQASGLTAGNYSVVIADAIGCLTAVAVTITEPSELTGSISSTPATCGDANGSAQMTASGGTGNLSYSWMPAGGNTANASGLTGGAYSVVVTDNNGCTISASIAVINSGGATASLQSSANVTCHGGNNGAASISVFGGALPYNYLWIPGGDTTASVSGITAGNYTVTITDSVGCVTSVTVPIAEPPAILIQAGMQPAGCNGAVDGSAFASVSGGTGPYTYSWGPVSGNDSILSNISAGLYTLQVTDQHGCIDSASVAVTSPTTVAIQLTSSDITCHGFSNGFADVSVISGTAPYTYNWLPSGGSNSAASNLGPGNYTVTVTDSNGCMTVETIVISEPPQLVLNVSGDEILCLGQSVDIGAFVTGGTAPYSFLWNNGMTIDSLFVSPSSTTSYSVGVTDAHGCLVAPQSILVTVHPPLNIAADATPEICEGDTAFIHALAGGGNGGPYFYSWNNGAIVQSEAMVFPANDSTFFVTVDDGCSPPVHTSVDIIVNPMPEADFLPHLIDGCMPVTASFTNHGNVPAGSSFIWNMGDGMYASSEEVTHIYQNPGHYNVSVTITSDEGCVAEMTVIHAVKVYNLPEAEFAMSAEEVTILTPSIDFFDQSFDASLWNWDFGDLNYSAESNPVHTYQDTGTYTITLIVENEHGCLDTSYRLLRIEDDFTVFIPDAFTPNGEFVNDNFMAHGIGWKDFEMFIIDRWGLEIFHSTSKENPWNGTFNDNGRECQSDVYEYVVLIRDKKDNLHKFLGHVTLVK